MKENIQVVRVQQCIGSAGVVSFVDRLKLQEHEPIHGGRCCLKRLRKTFKGKNQNAVCYRLF